MVLKYKFEGVPDYERVIRGFEVFDRNKTGVIPTQELRHILTRIGEKMTDEEFDEIVRATKVDSTHRVKYADFVSTFQEFAHIDKANG